MKKRFIWLGLLFILAAQSMDEEIINDLDFFQSLELVKDEENLKMEEDWDYVTKEGLLEMEVKDEKSLSND